MFSSFELEQKELAFNYCKEHFYDMNVFLNRETEKFRDEYTNYNTIFITLARFITYKEDIWIKDKKKQTISTNFSRSILDKYLFNGKLSSTKIAFESDRKQMHYDFTPIQITNILEGKEKDSVWIIDNIRDSIAHGHYYIDFTDNSVVIKNEHPDRLLNCSMKFDLFVGLNELITEERIGGYTDKPLTTCPFIYALIDKNKPFLYPTKTEYELRNQLRTNYIVTYTKILKFPNIDSDQKFKELSKLYNFNTRLREKIFRNLQGKITITDYYINTISDYIKNNMKGYEGFIFSNNLEEQQIEQVISVINEDPKFYERGLEDQGLILEEIIKTVLSDEKITLERGVMDFVELYTHCSLKPYLTDQKSLYELNNLIFANVNSFKENKKLANLFILAINNFVSNKESVYDKYFENYEEFDLSHFNYKDYSLYDRLTNKLTVLNNDLKNTNNNLKKATDRLNKLQTNLQNAPKDKQDLISNNIESTKNIITLSENKINLLTSQIAEIEAQIDLAEQDECGKYINFSNKSFFNHIRNAFAHSHVRYAEDRLVYNRKIILEDFDDNGNLTFTCACRYYDLIKLLNNDLFLEALNQTKKTLTKKK